MKILTFILFIFPIFLLLSCVKSPENANSFGTSYIDLKKVGGNFTLKTFENKKEREWSLNESNGKLRILYFGFTFCPDICPMSLTKLLKLLGNFTEEDRNQVLPVFISVDYKRDNAQKVDRYSKYYSTSIIGLAGNKEEIEKVTKQYGVYFKLNEQKNSRLGYSIDHTSRYFLIDKEGNLINSFSTGDPEFVKTLRKFLEK